MSTHDSSSSVNLRSSYNKHASTFKEKKKQKSSDNNKLYSGESEGYAFNKTCKGILAVIWNKLAYKQTTE